VIDYFLGLISLKDATAETLYDKVIAFFSLNKMPYMTNLTVNFLGKTERKL